jgi:hypothetical protein
LCGYLENQIGRVQLQGEETQLLLRLDATTKGGEKKQLLALVDTGAQVNLFRSGLFHACDTTKAQNPISLVTVDGTRLGGGDKEIELVLTFLASTGKKQTEWKEKAVFLDGDIQVDLILGYPWLRRTQLGILPHKGALFHEQNGGTLRLLRSVKTRTRVPTDGKDPTQQQVNVRGVQETPQCEDLEERLLQIQKLQLCVPRDTENGDNMLSRQAQLEISEQLRKTEEMTVARVITSDSSDSEWGEHQALVDELRAKLHEDYDNIVLGEEIFPDPPHRGPHCTAHIFLKPGAQPKKQKQILLQGERRDAMIVIAQNWLNKLRTEPCEGPWSSPAFPVRKKIYDWRGVVDARYMNTQCMDDAYPLPRIMDILVRMGRKKIFRHGPEGRVPSDSIR